MNKYTSLIPLLSLISGITAADILIKAEPSTIDCKSIITNWNGTAKVDGPLSTTCTFSGKVNVKGSGSTFNATINADKTGGPFWCPGSISETIPGKCDASSGAITLNNSDINLSGTYNGDNHIDLSGKIEEEAHLLV